MEQQKQFICLDRAFYMRDALSVAAELPGKLLTHRSPEGLTRGRIVETEAYMGPGDRASHTHGGVPTPRTAVLFGEGGYAYVYLIYGLHYCLNIAVHTAGSPQAVLIRALEPLQGIDVMRRRRRIHDIRRLCDGPGKLCTAMGITGALNGVDICGRRLYLEADLTASGPAAVTASARIGVDRSGEAAAFPWRFTLDNNPFVSRRPGI